MGRFIPRSESGLPDPQDNDPIDPSQRTGFVVHWDGGETPTTVQRERELMLAYERYHVSLGNGGFDYNLAVGPVSGDVYDGRGLDQRGTHAGGANTANLGVILIGGPGNLTEAGKQGLREAYALACQYTGRSLLQRVHSDINSTACPGDDVRAWVHGGGLVGANAPAGSDGASSGEYVGENITDRPTEDIQRLVGADPDNDYGTDTTAKVRAWQEPRGLVADGVWGPLSDAIGFPLKVDGALGVRSIARWQYVLGTPIDGEIDEEDSALVKEIQRRLNAAGARDWEGKELVVDGEGIYSNEDSEVGKFRTVWALQVYVGIEEPDGYLDAGDSETIRRVQTRLNEGRF